MLHSRHAIFVAVAAILFLATIASSSTDLKSFTTKIHSHHGKRSPRVVGGFNATEGQFKYIASLQILRRLHYCGGAVISHRTILTAAHCRKTIEVTAMIGSIYYQDETARRHRVEKFIVHEKYDSLTLNYDIALAILDCPIEFDDFVQPILLVTKRPSHGERMILSGWGYTSYPPPSEGPPNQMQYMMTSLIEDSVCDEYHPDVYTHLCVFEAENHGICSGDSGGPLVNQDNELVGVISAGYACAIGYPDSCTDVFMFRKWIYQHFS